MFVSYVKSGLITEEEHLPTKSKLSLCMTKRYFCQQMNCLKSKYLHGLTVS